MQSELKAHIESKKIEVIDISLLITDKKSLDKYYELSQGNKNVLYYFKLTDSNRNLFYPGDTDGFIYYGTCWTQLVEDDNVEFCKSEINKFIDPAIPIKAPKHTKCAKCKSCMHNEDTEYYRTQMSEKELKEQGIKIGDTTTINGKEYMFVTAEQAKELGFL